MTLRALDPWTEIASAYQICFDPDLAVESFLPPRDKKCSRAVRPQIKHPVVVVSPPRPPAHEKATGVFLVVTCQVCSPHYPLTKEEEGKPS